MAYFSNGTEGMDYQAQYCVRCVHDTDDGCPVWMAHVLHNSDQNDNEAVESVLSVLIPRKDRIWNDKCAMFIAKP
jgi:hypothetical protein